eukprot:7677889-Ditylum_brightwellii.AAC.1
MVIHTGPDDNNEIVSLQSIKKSDGGSVDAVVSEDGMNEDDVKFQLRQKKNHCWTKSFLIAY